MLTTIVCAVIVVLAVSFVIAVAIGQFIHHGQGPRDDDH